MKYDLPQMLSNRVQSRRRGRRVWNLRGIEVTAAIEQELYRIAVQVVNLWGAAISDELLPVYERELDALKLTRDDANDTLSAIIDATDERAHRLVLSLSPALRDWTVRVVEWHKGRWVANVKAGTGIDVGPLISALNAEPEITAFQQWASGLIKGISDDMRRRVETATFKAVIEQTSRFKLAKELADALAIGRGRARLIAEDQANKLSGKLDELRHVEAGIDRYRWETARDDRVRPTHRANQGKVFAWNKPPATTGHPRTEIRCRCTAQPYIDLLEDVEPSQTELEVFGV